MFRCSKREGAHVRRIACDAIIRLGFRQTGDAFRRGCRRFGIGGPGCGPFCRGSRRRASGVRARATKEILRTSESSPQEARSCADRRNDRFPPCPENRRKELRRGTRTAPPRASAIAIPARRRRTPSSPWGSSPPSRSNTAVSRCRCWPRRRARTRFAGRERTAASEAVELTVAKLEMKRLGGSTTAGPQETAPSATKRHLPRQGGGSNRTALPLRASVEPTNRTTEADWSRRCLLSLRTPS